MERDPLKQKEIDNLENMDIEVVEDSPTLDELEKEWDRFTSMPLKHRRVSDWKSIELFGQTNQDRYDDFKSDLLAKDDFDIEDIPLDESSIIFQKKDPIKKIIYKPHAIDLAKEWSVEAIRTIIIPCDNEIELDNMWEEWNLMIKKHKRESDWKSLELFGVNNQDHYEYLKSKFLKKDIPDQQLDSDDTIEPDVIANKVIDIDESSIYDKRNYIIGSSDIIDKIIGCIELEASNTTEYADKILIEDTINKVIEIPSEPIASEIISCSPYFSPDEMEDMGVYSTDLYFSVNPDNKILDPEGLISTNKWFDEYKNIFKGIQTEEFIKYTPLWIHKLEELYLDYDKIKESNDINLINARKQSILELGWNPEIDFTTKNREKALHRIKYILNEKYQNLKIYDIRRLINSIDTSVPEVVNEGISDDVALYPIYIVTVYTGSKFGKLVRKFTKAVYSHASLGFDSDLKKLYSFNLSKIYNAGFSLESLNGYISDNKDAIMSVYAVFVRRKDLLKIENKLDYYIMNRDKTNYSIANIFGILANKSINIDMKMICSQFVDSMLKLINVDITGKDSSIVTPKDFNISSNKKVYRIYEGKCSNYDSKKVDRGIKALSKKAKYIKESLNINSTKDFVEMLLMKSNDISSLQELSKMETKGKTKELLEMMKPYIEAQPIIEVKDFFIQFNKDGDLLIRNRKNLNFESEYSQSHKLLLAYDKQNNLEGMKYELSKLWFMNSILEKKIFTKGKSTDEELIEYNRARAKILNDFNKYLKRVIELDTEFNFQEYYNNSPFSDASTRISKHTLKYSGELIKMILK